MLRLASIVAAVALVAAVVPGSIAASQLVDRNASNVSLAVNASGEALVTYRDGGTQKHVLAWGALNALAPSAGARQVAFQLDYTGGYDKYHRTGYWKSFVDACTRYDGPQLMWLVTACKAPDGSYWALQSWQRGLPDYGAKPTDDQAAWELRLSHWQGPTASFDVKMDWAYHRFQHLYGTYSYAGNPVYGFAVSPTGEPLDTWGRNVYVDSFDSDLGKGWKRVNSFLVHAGTGVFCYGFFPHKGGTGAGLKYRATVIGPGVTPDMYWSAGEMPVFDKSRDLQANHEQDSLGDRLCKGN
jgi:hypothetical protein